MAKSQHIPFCPGGFPYIVQRGDTMFLIAQRFNIPLDELIAANPHIADPDHIFPGQVICVPFKERFFCPGGFIYVVRRGDTLFEIARRFGTTVERIVEANPQITDPNLIYPGQRLCIPVFRPLLLRRLAFALFGTEHAPQAKGMGLLDGDQRMVTVVAWDLPDPHTLGMDKYMLWVRYREEDDFVTEDMHTVGHGMLICHHRLRPDPSPWGVLPFLVVGVRLPLFFGPVVLGGLLPVWW
ncbi:spore coat assembly protein SafA [Thermanaeromonas toyohensis ToBE]|uniref:Spore coat assembly protein SafA n=1 Tax=Thermanaeromonas toyohensis ToBE TaxID=698762 RepID=A0A1W1VY33_9FIRM|nr:LysM peptidoglycan-binding domain-containing protein [Thermanaeromonas toyohensis]SMB98153.1 spore coat assembly protein SafA [Thermanaeromonas toyohensis ToBE]